MATVWKFTTESDTFHRGPRWVVVHWAESIEAAYAWISGRLGQTKYFVQAPGGIGPQA